MQYRVFQPPDDLLDVVEHFWAVENPVPLEAHREILIPNGRPTVLVCLAEPGLRIPADGPGLSNQSNVAGPITAPLILEQSGVSSYAAAQLRPWGLSLLGIPALVDTTRPLATVIGQAALDTVTTQCRREAFGPGRVAPLIDLLRDLRQPMAHGHLAMVRAAVEAIDTELGLIEIERLSADLGVGHDRLYRHFKWVSGLSPKRYASIMRFYHFAAELLKGEVGSLAQLASLQGYYDQAHAAREFKRYTGISQRRFRTTLNGIARLMQIRADLPDSYKS